jgi:hypothetical protein
MTMTLVYKLVGYDRETGKIADRHMIPAKHVAHAKRIARVDPRDPNAVWVSQLDAGQTKEIAGTIGAKIDLTHREYFLEPYSEAPLPRQRAHA